jgi:hypothetical protein
MKTPLPSLIFCFSLLVTAAAGQDTYRFSVEGSLSAGVTVNKGSMVGNAFADNLAVTVYETRPAISTHWTAGIGVHLSNRHSLWLRLGRNDPALSITADHIVSLDFASQFETRFEDYRQGHGVDVWRLEYEYGQPVRKGQVLFSLGYQLQRNFSLADIVIASQSFHTNTQAMTAAIGYARPILPTLAIIGRLRAINTFRSKGEEFFVSEDLDFSPIQVVAELGVRYSFWRRQQSSQE